MTKDTSGQAFPTHPALYSSADQHLAQGMSLRDWFAGQALIALAADLASVGAVAREAKLHPSKALAQSSYQIADAMIAARALTTGENDD